MLGRFVQPDTIVPEPGNPQDLNRYTYAGNNPLIYTDPSGHCPWCITIGAGALIGGGISYGTQVAANISQNGLNVQAFTDENWASVGAGAVAGAVGGAPLGVGTGAMWTGGGGTGGSGDGGGGAAREWAGGVGAVLSGAAITAGLGDPTDIARHAVIGGGLAGAGRVASNLLLSSKTALASHYGDQLPLRVRAAFSGWQAESAEFSGGAKLYRVHNAIQTGQEPYGHWWLLESPSSEIQFRIDYAVSPEWNVAQQMSILRIPEGSSLSGWEGRAAYQGGLYVGGGRQVYLPEIPRHWITTGPVPW